MFDDMQSGRYVVAVSGGVDSVVLLHLLMQQNEFKAKSKKLQSTLQPDNFQTLDSTNCLQFVVAHYDHGIREDSALDRKFVGELARQYSLPFVYDEGGLGSGASEAAARKARYTFLHTVRQNTGSHAIITAHHQDDLIETALLNLLRGTNRKGLSSLASTDHVKRPLLHVPKQHLVQYAKANGLNWREDSTNQDMRYKRNYVRNQLITKLSPNERQKLLAIVRHMRRVNDDIERELANHLHVQPYSTHIDIRYFRKLPHDVALEMLAAWLRKHGARGFDKKKPEPHCRGCENIRERTIH